MSGQVTKGGPVYPEVARSVQQLGKDIALARRTRRISTEDFAERMGVSRGTLRRLEGGDAGCSLNTLASALHVLGQLDRLFDLVAEDKDEVGLMLRRGNAPRRIARTGPVVEVRVDEVGEADEDDSVPSMGW